MLLHDPFLESPIERLDLGAGRNLGEEVLADLLVLIERGETRFDGVELQDASGGVELDHPEGELIEFGHCEVVGRGGQAGVVDWTEWRKRHAERTMTTRAVFPR